MNLHKIFRKLLRETIDDSLVKDIIMCNAYWISPIGEMFSVKSTHIDVVIENPKIFGVPPKYIKEIYEKHRETIGSEGKARDEIIGNLIDKKWIRIRYDKGLDYFIIGIKCLEKNQLDYLSQWGKDILTLDESLGIKDVHLNNMTEILSPKCTIRQLF